MRSLVLALFMAPAFALPPVTEEEGIAFHKAGLCSMASPGTGIHGARGWIGAYLPGRTRLLGAHRDTGEDFIDGVPGRVTFIVLEPGALVQWCPEDARPVGRDACGPVPRAFLYDLR